MSAPPAATEPEPTKCGKFGPGAQVRGGRAGSPAPAGGGSSRTWWGFRKFFPNAGCAYLANSHTDQHRLNPLVFKGLGRACCARQWRATDVCPPLHSPPLLTFPLSRGVRLPSSQPNSDHARSAPSSGTLPDVDLYPIPDSAPPTRSKGERKADAWARRRRKYRCIKCTVSYACLVAHMSPYIYQFRI
jgi:hypothetical protein